MHAEILDVLRAAGEVSLVARLRDQRLGFPSRDQAFVFIPDLHLLSNRRVLDFSYWTNSLNMFERLCDGLIALKRRLGSLQNIEVFQLGDLLDLWREDQPRHHHGAAERIEEDHKLLVERLREAGCHFVLGNHDVMLYDDDEFREWNWRYFVGPGAGSHDAAMILHGDLFDWLESWPRRPRAALVGYFGKYARPNRPDLDASDCASVVKMVEDKHTNYQRHLRLARPADLGAVSTGADPDSSRVNVQTRRSHVRGGIAFLDKAAAECARFSQKQLRLVVIGHTHRARIALREGQRDDDFFALVDCGAWIEQCRLDNRVRRSAQIGVLSANEVRLYQLDEQGAN